jgi:hypothetical protein
MTVRMVAALAGLLADGHVEDPRSTTIKLQERAALPV